MKKHLTILVAFYQISFGLYSQINKPQFIPPSPNAYSLAKFGDVPVSLYTGVPDISIPVWTLRENDLSVNISLSYHGSGIKVDETASWAGLGWSLNAGGTIVRKVRGRAEYLLSNGTLMPTRAEIQFYNPSQYSSISQFIDQNGLQAAANNGLDTEPDEYYFNFAGRTGKFYFNKEGKVFLEQHEGLDIRLEYVSSYLFNIIITSEEGTVYKFADYERTFFKGINQTHITAWYLSSIKSPSGNEISFEYQATGSVNHDIRESSDYVIELTTNPIIYPSVTPVMGVLVYEIRIKKITSGNGWIEFTPGTSQRIDYKTVSYPLDAITIHQSDRAILRKFKLLTSYFEANNKTKYNGVNPNHYQHLNYRLRLDALQELSGEGLPVKPPYRFTYWGDNNPSTNDIFTLPYRLSPKQDHWGYFNNSANSHIFPGNSERRGINRDPWYQEFQFCEAGINNSVNNGADRKPNAEAVKAGSLKEIKYPTGGYSEFQFEINRFSGAEGMGGGLRIGKIIEYTGSGEKKETVYTYEPKHMAIDPRDLYYKFFCIAYKTDGTPKISRKLLSIFGLPTNYSGSLRRFIKISTFPLAILGNGGSSGYGRVTVSQTGNGFTVNDFYDPNDFPDYNGVDDIYDQIDMFTVGDQYESEYITSMPAPGLPPDGIVIRKNTDVYGVLSPEGYGNDWKRGVPKSLRTYNKDSVLLKKETYVYDRKLLGVVPGYKVISWAASQEFLFTKYYAPNAWIYLQKHTVQLYDQNGANPLTSITEYFYDNPSHAQPTRKVSTGSDGIQEVTLTTYPQDYAQGTSFIDDMKTSRLSGVPVEQVTYRNHSGTMTLLFGTITRYKPGGKGLIDQKLLLETQNPIPLISFKFSNRAAKGVLPPTGAAAVFIPDSRYRQRLLYNSFDSKGNPLQYTITDGISTSFIWSYSGQYPIAEAKNATQNQISHTSFETGEKGGWTYSGTPVVSTDSRTGKRYYNLGTGNITKTTTGASAASPFILTFWARRSSGTGSWTFMGKTESLSESWKLIEREVKDATVTISGSGIFVDELRLHPVGAQMTTFTYDPLIGMTSNTNIRNFTTYYEYDSFGRLKNVKNEDGHILEHYEYNYAEGN